jgi:hypothetical protein
MNPQAATKAPQRRFVMDTTFGFIRRFADEAIQLAQLVSFNLEVEVELSEQDIVRDLEVRGYGVRAGS